MMTSSQILTQHINDVDAIFNQHAVETVGGEVALPESVKLPEFPAGVLFNGEQANAKQLIEEIASKLTVGYQFTEFNFADYAQNIHHFFASGDKDWEGVDVGVFVFEELDEDGHSYFGDGTNEQAHPTAKLLLVITSSVVAVLNFLPHPEGLEDLEPYALFDVAPNANVADLIAEIIESYDDQEGD